MAIMGEANRRKSPRAPSMALDEALERVLKIYEKDRIHPIPTDIAAKHMGYKGANNGAALGTLAALGYYGLLERPKDGLVAVSKDVESYKFAPTEDLRRAFLRRFLANPPLFAELLDRAQSGMPSDESLKYDLIQRGFLPATAAGLVGIFKRSVDFADALSDTRAASGVQVPDVPLSDAVEAPSQPTPGRVVPPSSMPDGHSRPNVGDVGSSDYLPIRLTGGRRAWLVVPEVFFEADKARIKAQIDLLLTKDEEDDEL